MMDGPIKLKPKPDYSYMGTGCCWIIVLLVVGAVLFGIDQVAAPIDTYLDEFSFLSLFFYGVAVSILGCFIWGIFNTYWQHSSVRPLGTDGR